MYNIIGFLISCLILSNSQIQAAVLPHMGCLQTLFRPQHSLTHDQLATEQELDLPDSESIGLSDDSSTISRAYFASNQPFQDPSRVDSYFIMESD